MEDILPQITPIAQKNTGCFAKEGHGLHTCPSVQAGIFTEKTR
jgi:hypothetical protein